MPRPARFDRDAILDAALRVAAAHGPAGVTTDAVADEMGGHVGSIYYRFPTKDHLLAGLWLRAARAGQAGLLEALGREDLDEAFTSAVLHYPRWSREQTAAAQMLAAHGREQVTPHWPDELTEELAGVNDGLIRALDAFTRRWYGDVTAVRRRTITFAVLDLPAGAIRRYLVAGKPPPRSLDGPVLAAARAALAEEAEDTTATVVRDRPR
ncbi:TetR/AcrR family transcriptional regulator [Actinomycetospora endophytica]|uniref:TetR/AcrR family transcriptional regulator n=1 Tax=Actinomycetospora endophytica TaxID=2291215 RepID=A0ABS8P4I7_9PSEU|nr:TetR/AcrR family transcriptional regulator [Actinomycetospora endophytica]MCD2193158.1 TetR/AcrR family transcriptional regulator [Actinomycetospora endophytica]